MVGPEKCVEAVGAADAAGRHVEETLLHRRRTDDGRRREPFRGPSLLVNLHLQAFAVIGRRLATNDDPDRIVRRYVGGDAARMRRRPAIAEQQDQFARMLDRVAEVDGVEPKYGAVGAGSGPPRLPIRVAGELADFISGSDTGDRIGRAGLGGACGIDPDQHKRHCESRRKSASHSDLPPIAHARQADHALANQAFACGNAIKSPMSARMSLRSWRGSVAPLGAKRRAKPPSKY